MSHTVRVILYGPYCICQYIFPKGAWIGFYGVKSNTGSIKFGWKNSDFSTAYTNWGMNEPNVDHFREGVETGVFMARVGKFWQSG